MLVCHPRDGSINSEVMFVGHPLNESIYNSDKGIASCFAEAAQLFGLVVSLKKTEVLHKPAPREEYLPPHITIAETELKPTPTRSVASHQMQRSTKKLTTD